MKKYLLKENGKFYKANLHMHTTVSDGKMSVEEVKKVYMEKGYSIVAYTDHEIMVPHNELSDENFLALTSTEISINEEINCDFRYVRTYHLNLFSKEKDKKEFSLFNEKAIWFNHGHNYVTEKQKTKQFNRKYTVDCINEIIKLANEEGMLVSYNHPVWSLQDYNDYINLKGLWGVEWYNNASSYEGYVDNIKPIDDFLRKGERVFPLATDDAHILEHCFGGFVMIKADNLEYETIYNALKNGDFYSSMSPEFYELYIEDGVVNVKTSKVKEIQLTTECRYTKTKHDIYGLTEASFDIKDYLYRNDNINEHQYIRINIIDLEGKLAYTRAYFKDELL